MQIRTTVMSFLILVILAACPGTAVRAQNPQGFTDSLVWNNAQRAADVLRCYYSKYKTFPQTIQDQDKALLLIYMKLAGSRPDSSQPISSESEFRVLSNLRIATNAIIRNAPLQQWRKVPPENWRAPAGSIVILTDGQSQFLIWCASANSVPIRDSNNLCMFIAENMEPQDEDAN